MVLKSLSDEIIEDVSLVLRKHEKPLRQLAFRLERRKVMHQQAIEKVLKEVEPLSEPR